MKNILTIILCVLVCYVTIALGWITKDMIIHENVKDGIAVLGYHGVVSDKEKKENYASNPYFMSVSQFEKQMKYLAENNYQCLSMKEVEGYYHGKKEISKKAVCLTFDDGYKNFNTVIKPIIKKYKLQATNFVIGYKTKTNNLLYLQKEDLKNDQYVEYYSHSYNMHHIGHLPYKKKIETMTIDEIKKDFEKNNVLYQYLINQDKLIIGKFCSIACGAKFIFNSANHTLSSLSTYPFPIFFEEWGLDVKDITKAWDNKGDIVVGNDVWIGYEAVILAGVTIGDGAVIGARAVVTKDVPPYTIVGGVPAKQIRKRFNEETIDTLLKLKWWDWSKERISKNIAAIQSGNLGYLL